MQRVANSIETNELCSYGCGQVAKYRNGSNKLMCCQSHSSCPVNKRKNSDGLKRKHQEVFELTGKFGLYDYDTLTQHTKDCMSGKSDYSKVEFTYGGKGSHKKALIQDRGHKCECCGLSEWLGSAITIELDHIDGDNKNNVRENLQLLCPNCHSQTPTWRGRNINSGKAKVSDDDLIFALGSTNSIRQALLQVGLTPKGGNYERCKQLNASMVKQQTQRA